MSLSDVEDLTLRALGACNTGDADARSVAASVVASEADGIHSHGLAAMAVANSYNCGVCGYHVERIAEAGLIALGYYQISMIMTHRDRPWGASEGVSKPGDRRRANRTSAAQGRGSPFKKPCMSACSATAMASTARS